MDLAKFESFDTLPGLDLQRLSGHLSKNGLEIDAHHTPERFEAGFGNMNFLVRVNGQFMVLRRPPLGPIPPGANDMAREFHILSHLHAAFPLVPRAYYFCGDVDVLNAPFFLMEYRPGLVIGATIPPDMAKGWYGRNPVGQVIGGNMIDLLSGLHSVDAQACGLGSLGRSDGFLQRTLRGWRKRAELSWQNDAPQDLEVVLAWLSANQPPETEPPTLIHNDFKLDNIILDPETLAPRTLIDWDMGTLGDPLYDLAVLLSYWAEESDPEVMHQLNQMPTARHGFPTREDAAQLYARASGRDLSNFTFHRVLSMLRLAVVFQQLYRRFESGGSDDPKFANFKELASGLLKFGLQISRGNAF